MCSITAGVAIGGLVASAAGTAVSISNQRRQADDMADIARMRSRQDMNEFVVNTVIADREMAERDEVEDKEKARLKIAAEKLRGEGRAKFAAGNIKLGGTGTVAAWEDDLEAGLESDFAEVELASARDKRAIRSAVLSGAYGTHRQQQIDRATLGSSLRNTRMSMAGTALGGAATLSQGAYSLGRDQGWGQNRN